MTSSFQPDIIIIAGEASGDMRAATVADHLQQMSQGLRITGIGGSYMQKSGVRLFENITSLAVIGFTDVLKNYTRLKKVFDRTLEIILRDKPKAVLLVDYPGFNLRLAKAIKKHNPQQRIVYYISPQVWAWKEKRVELIRRVIDQMIVLFPFEQEFYAQRGLSVDCAGHPLRDEIKITCTPEEFCTANKLEHNHSIIALLPGSRQKEIERHLPTMIETAQRLHDIDATRQFILFRADTIPEELITKYTQSSTVPITITTDYYNGINASTVCLVASGTASLETALLNKPMIILYKTSAITYRLAMALVNIKFVGLINIIANRSIIPEFIQHHATPERLSDALNELLTRPARVTQMRREITETTEMLGPRNSSRRAAEFILQGINQN